MKKGINQWAFPQDMPVAEKMRLAARAGFDCFEPALSLKGELSLESAREEILSYRALAQELGLEICSLATALYWDFPFTSPSLSIREKALDICRIQLEFAGLLGAPAILVVPGNLAPDEAGRMPDSAACWQLASDAVAAMIPLAEKANAVIALENVWNKFLLSPLEMRAFIDQFHSPWVKAYVDVANMLFYGYPQDWIKVLGERVCCVHAKDYDLSCGKTDAFCIPLEGSVDFRAVVKALEEAGFTGSLTAEADGMTAKDDSVVRRVSAALSEILTYQKG